MVQNIGYYKTNIQDSSLLLVVVGLLSFAVSCFFMGVLSDSMEGIFMTYLMDIDAGADDGKCPPELRDFIDEAQREQHMKWFYAKFIPMSSFINYELGSII